ncbi:putative ubiquitin-like-specific protease 1B isoform X2 [Carex littledalei]|uniref:Putative ubiquitin-like-specific protease 1B isoform X2 n=1 Tax=Carex littledalei TaxID=544730 RepID=A0A833QNP1_9POAL|nr:putative ubiquitin-like-specific protease 1B isoform X2 [Carex littledalei]
MNAFSKHRSKGKRSCIDFALPFSAPPLKKKKSQFRSFDLVKSFTSSSSHARDRIVAMGNILSLIFGKSKASTSHDSREKILGFQQYKSLVGETSKPDPGLVTRKGSDARSIVDKIPVYKRLYQETRQRDERLSSLDAEVKLTEISLRKEAHIIKVEEEEENLCDLFCPLTGEDEEEVDNALFGRDSHTILVTHESSNIEITKEIIRCLRPGGWLNDEVINLYLELLKERERRQPDRFLKCHFFNTFFYKKLIGGNDGYDYKAVRRWTTQKKLGYSLINCDKIFVPIHKGTHWCLAVINVKQKSLQYLDSLGGMDCFVLGVLTRYIVDEAKDKSNIEMDGHSWKQEIISLPTQKNGYDCGMFMLKYIDFLSRGISLSFSQENMEYFRKHTIKEILRLRAE